MHKELWWGALMGTDHMEDLGLNRKIILKWIFNELYGVECNGLL